MQRSVLVITLAVLLAMLTGRVAWAGQGPPDPLRQPRPDSLYGMDILGPAWQWTFPREEKWPRLQGRIRVDQLDEVFQKTWSAGVRSARMAAWWCILEPQRDKYDWEHMDYAFQIASNYGIEPAPEIFYTPDWAAIGVNTGVECIANNKVRNIPPANMDDWSDFMADFTARYGATGKGQVHDWEIWNEPDLWEFLYVPGDPDNLNLTVYADLVKRARKEVDIYDPGGRIVTGGISEINGPRFLTRLLELRGAHDVRGDIDVVAFHAFSNHGNKAAGIKGMLGENEYDIWVNEFNQYGEGERISPLLVDEMFSKVKDAGVNRTFWFKSYTTEWGPGIFHDREPLWVPGPFLPSAFMETYKKQALTYTVAAAPPIVQPRPTQSVETRPTFVWQRPEAGSFAIAGYKLQVDNSLYAGTPYFHTPEVDVWVPATHLQFLPFQQKGRTPQQTTVTAAGEEGAGGLGDAATGLPPAIPQSSFRPLTPLAPGIYYWRVAAVDEQGNVGFYTAPQRITVTPRAGAWSTFLPVLLH